ncbi:MAG: hypothetical protein NTW78_04060 [Campylobacterales bacterium]|nr:hypothetical protein [Campylobacterales bacterium]
MQLVFTNSYACIEKCTTDPEVETSIKIIELYKNLKKINKVHLFGK